MPFPLVIAAVAAAVIAAGEAFLQAEQQRAQKKYESDVAANNAIAMRQQAEMELQKGEADKRRVDTERDKLSRDYQAQAAANRSLLASGNVDMTAGSAADSLLGNAALFGEDVATNRYNWTLAGWQASENARQARYQATVYDSQSSWLKKSGGTLGTSLFLGMHAGGKSMLGSMGAGAFSGMGRGGSASPPTQAQVMGEGHYSSGSLEEHGRWQQNFGGRKV
ncbi:MAG: hypothetical protein LBH94_04970 [Deltaproteobacteria bacterium]|jgi:hypothetical protein|nr:hypothetical protein [Deltaproteobacteria bacterium]